MREITFICAFFENQGMLLEQQKVWSSYAPEIRKHFHAIVTDDCSPRSPARSVFEPIDIASYRLFRASKKRDWNWLFGRNLGVQEASTEWVLLTDIDHVLLERTLSAIMTEDLDAESVYRFSRVDAHGRFPWPADSLTPYKAHPNTWMMTRAMFDKVGGYDERFSGFYGSDSEFRERVQASARAVIMRPEPLVRYPREIVPDASTVAEPGAVKDGTGFERKRKKDGEAVPRIKNEREKIKDWKPLRVTLPYTLEASC